MEIKKDYNQLSLLAHKEKRGKWEIASKMPLETVDDLSIAYTPGVAEPCRAIAANPELAYELTMKGNSVAVVSDGTSVLGLGDIGPMAGLPVMEGKAVLYKKYSGIDGVPIVLASKDVNDIVQAVKMIAPTFGGIHLEDIAAPACFEIERRLTEELDIPVMHDDQHCTAIVVVAGLYNALKVVGKDLSSVRIVVNGAGAAGIAITGLLIDAGAKSIDLLDSVGIIALGREKMNSEKDRLAKIINPNDKRGTLAQALAGADVFIGVSRPGLVTRDMVASMNSRAIIFALANPTPEIMPEEALAGGAEVIATGRSDYPNQVNNVLVYPGLFRGLLDGRVRRLTSKMKLAAAQALADSVKTPKKQCILPSILEENPAEYIRHAILQAVV
ncbi:MAG: malic enzyme-like NAD(P)-binding protein [Patescibacteria group bacterium]|jgi:malate dehydrogenase (oxaloacetate-decarboxylating)